MDATSKPPRARGKRGPNPARREATRAKIVAAAIRCLNEFGYAETSTVRVAKMAPVARGSLLHQFPTRVDLILEVAQYASSAHSEYMRAGLAKLPVGRERFVGSVDVTWEAFQRPESRALIEIIIATRHDPELAARIPDFAKRSEASVTRGAHRFAKAAGLHDQHGEAAAERRLIRVALRGLAVETMLSGPDADPEGVIALLKRMREQFYDTHHDPDLPVVDLYL
jgi:AcrR family transcriptional regulator